MLHFRRNDSRFCEQKYTISSSVCPTGVVNVLLHVEVTPDIDLDSISVSMPDRCHAWVAACGGHT